MSRTYGPDPTGTSNFAGLEVGRRTIFGEQILLSITGCDSGQVMEIVCASGVSNVMPS